MPAIPQVETFVFQPGGTSRRFSEGFPIYTDFALLWADVEASTAANRTVLIDDTFTAAPTIPAGTYNFAGISLVGRWSIRASQQGFLILTIPTGVVILNCPHIEGVFVSLPNGVSTPFRWNTASSVLIRRAILGSVLAGTSVAMEVISGSTVAFLLDGGTIGTGSAALTLTGSSTVSFRVVNGGSIRDDSLVGGGTETVASWSVDLDSNINTAQPTFTGSVPGSVGGSNASFITYEPGTPGDWASPPTDVRQALDKLAAKVNANHGPV